MNKSNQELALLKSEIVNITITVLRGDTNTKLRNKKTFVQIGCFGVQNVRFCVTYEMGEAKRGGFEEFTEEEKTGKWKENRDSTKNRESPRELFPAVVLLLWKHHNCSGGIHGVTLVWCYIFTGLFGWLPG